MLDFSYGLVGYWHVCEGRMGLMVAYASERCWLADLFSNWEYWAWIWALEEVEMGSG